MAFAMPYLSLSVKGPLTVFEQPCHCPRFVAMAPTRELAMQISEVCKDLTKALAGGKEDQFPVQCVYGGVPKREQRQALNSVGVDMLVATPGRLQDLVDEGTLDLGSVQYLVLDEADRMLDMGFEPQIKQIMEDFDMPVQERQTMMFSATFPRDIQVLAQDYLKDYVFLAVGRVGSTTDSITQSLLYAPGHHQKTESLMNLLPKCDGLTLIFVATRRDADRIEHMLRQEGVNAEALSREDYLNAPGETYEVKFEKAGTYGYYCQPHQGAGMKGTIVVQ